MLPPATPQHFCEIDNMKSEHVYSTTKFALMPAPAHFCKTVDENQKVRHLDPALDLLPLP